MASERKAVPQELDDAGGWRYLIFYVAMFLSLTFDVPDHQVLLTNAEDEGEPLHWVRGQNPSEPPAKQQRRNRLGLKEAKATHLLALHALLCVSDSDELPRLVKVWADMRAALEDSGAAALEGPGALTTIATAAVEACGDLVEAAHAHGNVHHSERMRWVDVMMPSNTAAARTAIIVEEALWLATHPISTALPPLSESPPSALFVGLTQKPEMVQAVSIVLLNQRHVEVAVAEPTRKAALQWLAAHPRHPWLLMHTIRGATHIGGLDTFSPDTIKGLKTTRLWNDRACFGVDIGEPTASQLISAVPGMSVIASQHGMSVDRTLGVNAESLTPAIRAALGLAPDAHGLRTFDLEIKTCIVNEHESTRINTSGRYVSYGGGTGVTWKYHMLECRFMVQMDSQWDDAAGKNKVFACMALLEWVGVVCIFLGHRDHMTLSTVNSYHLPHRRHNRRRGTLGMASFYPRENILPPLSALQNIVDNMSKCGMTLLLTQKLDFDVCCASDGFAERVLESLKLSKTDFGLEGQ